MSSAFSGYGARLLNAKAQGATRSVRSDETEHSHSSTILCSNGVPRTTKAFGTSRAMSNRQEDTIARTSRSTASAFGDLLKAAKGTEIEAAVIAAIGTGLRRGELCALRWCDIDLEKDGSTFVSPAALLDGKSHHEGAEDETIASRRIHPGVRCDGASRASRSNRQQRHRLLGIGNQRRQKGPCSIGTRHALESERTVASVLAHRHGARNCRQRGSMIFATDTPRWHSPPASH